MPEPTPDEILRRLQLSHERQAGGEFQIYGPGMHAEVMFGAEPDGAIGVVVAFNAGTGMLLLGHWLVRRGRIQRLTAERDRLRAMLGYPDEDTGA